MAEEVKLKRIPPEKERFRFARKVPLHASSR